MQRRKRGWKKAAAEVWQENYEQQAFHAGQNGRCMFAAVYGGHGIRRSGKISRVASAPFGSFDPFCSVWHFVALLANGVGDWQPHYYY